MQYVHVVFIVNVEHFTPCSSVSIVSFEQVNAGWQTTLFSPLCDQYYHTFPFYVNTWREKIVLEWNNPFKGTLMQI